jgi:RNA polymerase sigma-70 factor (ECF subfamily)
MITDLSIAEKLKRQLEEIFTGDYSKLYSCVFRIVGNHQDTEDVLQNAFIKAYRNIDKFRGQAKLSTWVYRILLNESYRFLEQIRKLPLVRITQELEITENEFFHSIHYTPNLEDNLIIEEMREKCLQGFLKCIPKNQRVCFLLKCFLNLKNQEIAEILDISVDNVKVTLYRGRKRLQEMMEMRCSLIDPEKPCKCHLWIKYMRDHNLQFPDGYDQLKMEDLRQEHFHNMSSLNKIEYLYTVEARMTKSEFINKIRKVIEMM